MCVFRGGEGNSLTKKKKQNTKKLKHNSFLCLHFSHAPNDGHATQPALTGPSHKQGARCLIPPPPNMLDPHPAAWRLLGQGGAAAVFAYCGSVQELVRVGTWRRRGRRQKCGKCLDSSLINPFFSHQRHHVLRVPKAGPPPASALDAAVWDDVPAVASAPGERRKRGFC